MLRILTLAGGLAGAVGLSQFPEFSQQYLQRLSGAVDELRTVATGFDLSAAAAGLTREEALAQIEGSEFKDQLHDNLETSLKRYDRLNADYEMLSGKTALQRLARPWRFADADLARRTWDDYKPAVPVTTDGLVFAGIGYVGGRLLLGALLWLLLRPFRRRGHA